jgi:hypothetical protein
LVLTSLAAVALTWTGTTSAETWTDLRGTHSVDAKMIGIWDDNVILELRDGRRVSVRLDNLRGDSRIQAQQLATGLKSSRSSRVKELQGQAAAAAAPAPNPLPQPPPAPPYTAPQPNAQPVEFLTQLETAIKGGHIVAIFDALPPSYRNDVNEIVKLAAQKIDPNTWQTLVGTAHQLGDLIVTHQRWFLSSPRIEALPPDQHDKIEGEVLTFAGLLRDGLSPEAMQLDQLQTMDFGQWLAGRDQAIAPHLAQIFQQFGNGTSQQFTVESEQDGTAVVNIERNGVKARVTYTLVEGYWVPKTIADKWAESVESWKKELAETPAGSMLGNYALMLEPIAPMLEPLASATDAGRFHEEMEAILVPAETIATTLATMLGKNINLASRGGPGGGYGGYDDGSGGYDQQMEMEMEMQMQMEMEMEQEMQNQGDQQP